MLDISPLRGKIPTSGTFRTKYVVAVMACYNRKPETLRALESLAAQEVGSELVLSVVLVDDASNDGTSDAVGEAFPAVEILSTTGNLYWAKSMRVGMLEALSTSADLILWLNDDVSLAPNAMDLLLSAARATQNQTIIVGALTDREHKFVTYSGFVRKGPSALSLRKVAPSGQLSSVDTMNGNVVLIPRLIFDTVGAIRPYAHGFGDIDYGYRAIRAGFSVALLGHSIGTCDPNSVRGTWRDDTLSLRRRLALTLGPKGLPISSHVLIEYRFGSPGWWPIGVLWRYGRAAMSLLGLGGGSGKVGAE